jgi:hypothetical protein
MQRYLVKEISETALNSNKFVKKYKNNLDSEITLQRLENFLEENSELEHYSSLMVKY